MWYKISPNTLFKVIQWIKRAWAGAAEYVGKTLIADSSEELKHSFIQIMLENGLNKKSEIAGTKI